MCVCLLHAPNWQPGSQSSTQSTEPHQPGQVCFCFCFCLPQPVKDWKGWGPSHPCYGEFPPGGQLQDCAWLLTLGYLVLWNTGPSSYRTGSRRMGSLESYSLLLLTFQSLVPEEWERVQNGAGQEQVKSWEILEGSGWRSFSSWAWGVCAHS